MVGGDGDSAACTARVRQLQEAINDVEFDGHDAHELNSLTVGIEEVDDPDNEDENGARCDDEYDAVTCTRNILHVNLKKIYVRFN